MKKAIAILLVAVVAIGSVFAGVSIDARLVGVGASYGFSYEADRARGGFDVSMISPAYMLYEYIMLAMSGQGSAFSDLMDEVGIYMVNPSAYSLYFEYDLIPAKVVDFSLGMGLTFVLPTGFLSELNTDNTSFTLTMINPTIDVDLAINFSEHHAFTARVVCPLTTFAGNGSQISYVGPYGAAILSSVGYRFTF